MAQTKTTVQAAKVTEQEQRLARKRCVGPTFSEALSRVRTMAREFTTRRCRHRRDKKVLASACPQCVHDTFVGAWMQGVRYEKRKNEPHGLDVGTLIIAEGPEKWSTDAEVLVSEAKHLRDLGIIEWDRDVGFFVTCEGKTLADAQAVYPDLEVMSHTPDEYDDEPDDGGSDEPLLN